jgi:hypothetical protein
VGSGGAGRGVPQAISHGGELENLSVQLVRFGRELLAVDAGMPVRREHQGDFIERETGPAPECNECKSFEYSGIELTAQAAPADRGDQPLLFIEAQCRDR